MIFLIQARSLQEDGEEGTSLGICKGVTRAEEEALYDSCIFTTSLSEDTKLS